MARRPDRSRTHGDLQMNPNPSPKSTFSDRSPGNAWPVTIWLLLGVALLTMAFLLMGIPSLAGGSRPVAGAGRVAPFSVTGEVDQSRLRPVERFDHSVVNEQSTAHDSDMPGASIGTYAP